MHLCPPCRMAATSCLAACWRAWTWCTRCAAASFLLASFSQEWTQRELKAQQAVWTLRRAAVREAAEGCRRHLPLVWQGGRGQMTWRSIVRKLTVHL